MIKCFISSRPELIVLLDWQSHSNFYGVLSSIPVKPHTFGRLIIFLSLVQEAKWQLSVTGKSINNLSTGKWL